MKKKLKKNRILKIEFFFKKAVKVKVPKIVKKK